MKKADVLQLAIVIVGIIFGFLTLQYIFSSLFTIFAWIFAGGYAADNYLGSSIGIYIAIGFQAICCWLLITKSGKLASYIHERSNLGAGFKITTNIQSLLYVILIALGIYLLLSNFTPFISSIFKGFKDRVSSDIFRQEDQRPVEWTRLVLDILLPLILLICAKPIAAYFAKGIGEEPVAIEETIDATEITETKES